MIYAAESAALAVLEVRVHLDLDWDVLPDDYVLVAIAVPDGPMEALDGLPDDPASAGDDWIASGRSALLRVPSFIIPEASNVLINPAHPEAAGLAIASMRPFRFDRRLWPAG